MRIEAPPASVANHAPLAMELPSLTRVLAQGAEAISRRNEAAFGEVALRQRILVDVTGRDLSVEVLDGPISMPVRMRPRAGTAYTTPTRSSRPCAPRGAQERSLRRP
jgi:isopentenyl diphosphate isomerase/L-lactate dehydrogenase-like FMN-dependent dehydrogenase